MSKKLTKEHRNLMKKRGLQIFIKYSCLIVLLVVIASLLTFPFVSRFFYQQPATKPHLNPTPFPTSAPTPYSRVRDIEQAILDNIKANGTNNDSSINNGLGGLWINWRYGSSPLQTNFNGKGSPDGDSVNPPRHDPFTDLRYLHTLWLYQSQNPTDTRYQSEIEKYTAIIKAEFTNSKDVRGWLFDEEFMDLYHLSHDPFYQDTAISLVEGYARRFDPKIGSLYKTNSAHPLGSYRVDQVLESGCALIQAGSLFHHLDWVQKGESIVNFVYAHAYIPQYHTFPEQMDRVHQEDGTPNPSQVFFSDSVHQSYTVSGNVTRMGAISQIILSLLHTYQVTHQQDLLNKALDLLDPLSLPQNSLGLWDKVHKGYFVGVTFTGADPRDPGEVKLKPQSKEAGRQMIMLQVFHLANTFTNNRYQIMEEQMRDIAINKAYYAAGRGVLYEMNPDWTLLVKHGQPEDWVTTEAMGVELEALLTTHSGTF